jgi:hypothetical protein
MMDFPSPTTREVHYGPALLGLAPLGDNPCKGRICGILHAETPFLVIFSSKYYLY